MQNETRDTEPRGGREVGADRSGGHQYQHQCQDRCCLEANEGGKLGAPHGYLQGTSNPNAARDSGKKKRQPHYKQKEYADYSADPTQDASQIEAARRHQHESGKESTGSTKRGLEVSDSHSSNGKRSQFPSWVEAF